MARVVGGPGYDNIIHVKDETAPPAQQRLPGAPVHVGVIMDGNGRWAARRGLPRIEGHRRGVEALRETVRAAIDFGLDYLTVYSFSMENWNRPVEEVADLMGLLKRFIRNDLNDLHKSGVKVKVIGARDNLKADIRALLEEAENLTKANTRLTLIVAFNYGSRQEIAAAARALAQEAVAGLIAASEIDETLLARHLDTAVFPTLISSSERLANRDCQIFSCGRRPIPSSFSCPFTGPTSTGRLSRRPWRNFRPGNGGLAA